MSTYRVDLDYLTVIRTDKHGVDYDLNAEGYPCETFADLAYFISELCALGAFGEDVMNDLLTSLPAHA